MKLLAEYNNLLFQRIIEEQNFFIKKLIVFDKSSKNENLDSCDLGKMTIHLTKNQLSDLGRTIALAYTMGAAETSLDDGRRVYVNFGENYNLSLSLVHKGKIYLYGSKEDLLNINKAIIEAYKTGKAEVSDSFMRITFLIKD